MPAKSFIAEIEGAARHFYATVVRGEVSDANVRAYLRAASQIEDIWQTIDTRLAELQRQGTAPWDAYTQLRYPLIFVRAARTYQVFVQELLAADAASDPATAGFLPRITYDQANALCQQIQPNLERALEALNDPVYTPRVALPLRLGPRLEAHEHAYPLQHLQGTAAAAHEVREWAAGLLAQYELAVRDAIQPAPEAIQTHIAALDGRLARGDSQLRFAVDLLSQLEAHEAAPALRAKAEGALWQALRTFFLLNQCVAMPELLHEGTKTPRLGPGQAAAAKRYHDRHIHAADLWRIAAPSARGELKDTHFASAQMRELCAEMGGILTAGAQRYLDDVEAAEARGEVVVVAAMAHCPYEPLYRAKRTLEIAGAHIPAGYEFHWNYQRGHIESAPRFQRVAEWQASRE